MHPNHLTTTTSNLKLAVVNFCSVTNKRPHLEVFLVSNNVDILIGTESHLDESYLNSEIFPRNYSTYRKDRNCYGGGVFISVQSTIPSYQIDVSSTSIEIIWVYLHIGKTGIAVGSFYGPPHSPDSLLDDLLLSITEIKHKFPHTQVILGGDFNRPGIDWEYGTLLDSYVSHRFREKLIALSQDTQMLQVVTFPTRAQNILDLCFVSHPNMILACEPVPGLSDHDAVLITFQTCAPKIKQNSRVVYLYKLADWDKIREELSNLTDTYFDLNQIPQSVDDNWTFFS